MEATYVKLLGPVIIYILKTLSERITAQNQDSNKVSEAVRRHLTQVLNWASNVNFFGMNEPKSVEQATIALDIYTQPRRFQNTKEPNKAISENDLLTNEKHVLLLGEPGSGKTTTIKRLALTMLVKEPVAQNDIYQFPMVIRLNELVEGESLFSKIADILGLVTQTREVTYYIDGRDERGRPIKIQSKRTEIHIGDGKVEDVIPKFLNEGYTLLLLDGLDELKSDYRDIIRKEIVKLGLSLDFSKIIVSCRTGDYRHLMEGFSVLEISPLSEKQINSIKDRWLGKKETTFIERYKNLPYFDLANRPLLLTQLLFMYKRSGYLPEQPSQIYKKLISLLLEDWDSQREIRRSSQYAGFDPRQKAEFLAALAYQLTYSLDKKRFNERDLIKAYMSVCKRFNLPENEAQEVAREIQTHNGIIIIGPNDIYEFCHLSLQEYLCADYLVRTPLETLVTTYLSKYSSPLAVAVSLSSNPSSWFSALILNFGNLKDFDEDSMISFLSRILI